ncbi:MAG: O-acetylhomoserine aminocarboxypropyltransferase/cysteine synthase family protein [Akkermansia sp.]
MSHPTYHPETLALHAGQPIESDTLSRGVPVYRTSAFIFKNTQHGANLFGLKELGNIYARLMNPTNDVLEQRIAQLEGGVGALSLSSGTAAIHYTILNILKSGDELVAANNLYGGTYTMFDAILPQQGITTKFTQLNDFDGVERAITEKTRALYIEVIGNPVLDVANIKEYARIAQKHHLPLIVDSTFSPPTFFNPIKYGANIVIHSLTKWIGGHGTGIGGIVVDAGTFDWTDPKFDLYNQPDKGYHGLRFAHDLGELQPLAFILRMRTVLLRNLGATLSPDSAWIFLQGVETLPLRMAKHAENALLVAQYLQKHPQVAWVRYPGLVDDPAYPIASELFEKGFGGMLVFGLKGGYDVAVKVIDRITLFSHLANVGDAKSLILHPSSTSHSQLSEEAQRASGLSPDLIRLSIGLEHPEDIIKALDDAIAG